MALTCNFSLLSSPSSLFTTYKHYSLNPKFSLNKVPKPAISPSLHAIPTPSRSSTAPIFLPFLQKQDLKSQQEEEEEEDNEKKNQTLGEDPLVSFFKTRVSSREPDPGKQGKLSLQKNRKTSWHLAADADFGNEEWEDEVERGSETGLVGDSKIAGVVGEIVDVVKSLPENTSLGEKLAPFEGKIGERECVEVLGLMGEEGLLMGSLWFFEWMGLQDPSLVTPQAYSVMFPLLGRLGKGEELLVLFSNLPNVKEFRDIRVYNAAISGLSCCERYEDAWKVYETMRKDNIRPDHVTCSIMITIMQKKGKSAKDSWEFFDIMNKEGVNWSVEVLGALIKSFCDEGLQKEALIIQSEMEKRGISSNAVVYNTLMDAFGKDNHIEDAEGLFAEMKIKGVEPTSATYNILMDAYSRRMQPEIVEKLFLEMQTMGLETNVKSYTCLISAYGRKKKMSDMAANAFLRMKKVGLKPSSHSYTALIHAYSLDGWHEKALVAFENMLREGLKPSIETYTALLDAFRRCGDTEMLMNIWKMMIRDKIGGTRVTFHTLVDGFAKQGRYVEARDVICEFGKIGLEPTVLTYNMLMNAYARGGQHWKLPQLLKEMSALNLKPDSITYSTMIYAYVRVRDFRRAFYYHKMMVKSGQVPDAKSYEKLRAILDVKATIKNKKDRKAILGIVKSNMGLLKPSKKGKKGQFWKNKKNKPRIRTPAWLNGNDPLRCTNGVVSSGNLG